MAKKFYGVKVGLKPGVYKTWAEVQPLIDKYPGAKHKSFPTEEEAYEYVYDKKLKTTIQPKSDNAWYAYVDGSFKNGNYSWAFAIVYNDKLICSSSGLGKNQEATVIQNIAGELAAAMRATKWAHDNKKVIVIVHDLEGTAMWGKGKWKTNNKYTEFYKEFMKQHSDIVMFQWVKGHSGDKWNEFVDKLAGEAHNK